MDKYLQSAAKHILVVLTVFLPAGASLCLADDLPQHSARSKGDYRVSDSQMVWGQTTNLLRGDWTGKQFPAVLSVGIRSSNRAIVLAGGSLKMEGRAVVYLRNSLMPSNESPASWSASNTVITYLPPMDQRVNMTMTDAAGVDVPKTSEGLKLGKKPILKRSALSFRWDKYGCQSIVLWPKADSELYPIDPAKYFAIERPGLYKLTLVQYMYIVDNNAYLKAIELPPVTIDVRVENANHK